MIAYVNITFTISDVSNNNSTDPNKTTENDDKEYNTREDNYPKYREQKEARNYDRRGQSGSPWYNCVVKKTRGIWYKSTHVPSAVDDVRQPLSNAACHTFYG